MGSLTTWENSPGSAGTMNKRSALMFRQLLRILPAEQDQKDPHRASFLPYTLFLQREFGFSRELFCAENSCSLSRLYFIYFQEKTTELQQAGVRSPQRIFLLAPFKPLPLGRGKRGACQKVWDYRLTGKNPFQKYLSFKIYLIYLVFRLYEMH